MGHVLATPWVLGALLVASSAGCILLVDEASQGGAGGEGPSSSNTTQTSAGGAGGEGAGTTTTSSGAGGGPSCANIQFDGIDLEITDGPVDRVARTPITEDDPGALLGRGGASAGVFFVGPTNDVVPVADTTAIAGLAYLHPSDLRSERAAVVASDLQLRLRGEDGTNDTHTIESCGMAGSVDSLASVASGLVFARCGQSIAWIRASDSLLWEGSDAVLIDELPAGGTQVRVAIRGVDSSYELLWDTWGTESSTIVQRCTFDPSHAPPTCDVDVDGEYEFAASALEDFDYSSVAGAGGTGAAFAITGGELRMSTGVGGDTAIFQAAEHVALDVLGEQMALSFERGSDAFIAVCCLGGGFVDAATRGASIDELCNVLGVGAGRAPNLLVLSPRKLYTSTRLGATDEGSVVRRYAIE
jgi:hypothetical protein